jgi:hypothetical protein
VRRAVGTLFTNGARSLIVPTEAGALSRMISFSLERATPGDYELVMTLEDEVLGKKVDMREPFTVVPAPAAPAARAPTVGAPPARTAPTPRGR